MSARQHLSVSPIAGAQRLTAFSSRILMSLLSRKFGRRSLEYQVLFFRDQELTREQQRAFARRFGTLNIHPFDQPLKDEGYPEFVVFQSDQNYPYVAQAWHADLTFLSEPPLGSVLRCVLAPPVGGDTMWVSMYAAYEALSEKMQHLLTGLLAIHDTSRVFGLSAYRHEDISDRDAGRLRSMSAEHPVVRTHPETRRKGLFVNSHFAVPRSKGMKSAESAALLNFFYRHIELPDLPLPMAKQFGCNVGQSLHPASRGR